jgi:hypothetical protein
VSKPSRGRLAAVVVALLFGCYLTIPRVVHSRPRYFAQYGRWTGWSYQRVTMDKMPDDCGWFTEPIGHKKCRYQAKVKLSYTGKDAVTGETVQYSGDQDGPLPPNFNKEHAHVYEPVVHIGWDKMAD